ncbi:MAG: hypothetical protein Q8Q09_07495 [Deltaproteobacteria bacterium]|nr:hypothetical protein [Deltaproteobacteria bacterium]
MIRTHWIAPLLGFLAGCGLFGTNNPPPIMDRGVGEACMAQTECRAGLRCNALGRCEAAGNAQAGQPCTLTADCTANLACSSANVCATAGQRVPGDPCAESLECVRGAVCFREPGQLVGTCRLPRGSAPVTLSDGGIVGDPDGGAGGGDGGSSGGADGGAASSAGGRDVGGACGDLLDCLPGLLCDAMARTCQRAGTVAARGVFRGATCGMDPPGVARAYFELPDATGAPRNDFFRLPFPNDARRNASTGRVNLTGFPTPGTGLLGFDVVDRYARAIERDLDGWGTNQWVYFRFSTTPDFATFQLGATIRLLDLTTGQPIGTQTYKFDTSQGKYLCGNYLGVSTGVGVPWPAGHTVAVVLTTAIRTASGPIERDADFVTMLAATMPTTAAHVPAWTAYAPLRSYLTAQSIDPNTILNATVFTTQDPRRRFEGIARAVAASAPSRTEGFVRCAAGVRSPCDDGLSGSEHVRGCLGSENPAFDEYQGMLDVPLLQRGDRPYRTPGAGAIPYDAMGTAVPSSVERVCATVTVPRGAMMPAQGWPVVLYAHGTGGNYRSVVTEGLSESLSNVALDMGRSERFVTVGFEGVMHGERRGMGVTEHPNTLFFNFANPEAARDNVLQGGADVLAFSRAFRTLRITPMGASELAFDPARVLFVGHSQGSTVGAAAVAYDGALAGSVFSGAGGDLRLSLTTKTSPVNIAGLVPLILQENADASHPVMQLFQSYFEPADAVNFGSRILVDRPMGAPLRPVVMTYGLGDTYSTVPTMQAFATALQLPAAAPIPGGMRAWPAGMGVMLPAQNNFTTSLGRTTALLLEADPMGMYDGHFVLFRDATLRARVHGFVATASAGMPVVR